jgi:thioesterase domain-containing protein
VAHELARSSRAHGKAEAGRVAPVPIVIIQPGSGTTIPLFCIHPVGGSVHCYGDLARALGTDHTVFGVEAPGLDGSRSPMPTATEMAEHYLRHLTAMHSGPYALAGWSLGGLIAFDLASRLRQAGRGVAVLALFDSSFPTDPPNGIDKSDRVHWISFIRNFERPDLHALIDADHRFWTLARMDRLAVIRKHVDPADDTCIDGSWIDRSYTVFEANRQAWRDYQPQVFDGRVTLFFAGASPARATFDRYRSRRGNMFDYVIHEVAADHYSIVRPPAVQSIARVIRSGI